MIYDGSIYRFYEGTILKGSIAEERTRTANTVFVRLSTPAWSSSFSGRPSSIDWIKVSKYSIFEPSYGFGNVETYGDVTPPTITITNPENKTYYVNTTDVNVSSDEAIIEWSYNLNPDLMQNYSYYATSTVFTPNMTLSVINGNNVLIVHAKDFAGNINSSTVLFTVTLSGGDDGEGGSGGY